MGAVPEVIKNSFCKILINKQISELNHKWKIYK